MGHQVVIQQQHITSFPTERDGVVPHHFADFVQFFIGDLRAIAIVGMCRQILFATQTQ